MNDDFISEFLPFHWTLPKCSIGNKTVFKKGCFPITSLFLFSSIYEVVEEE